MFIAASQDARFRAFDARTGKELWVADLTENGRAVPITYHGKSGKQYVAIMAGGGRPVARKVDESLIGGRLHVFAVEQRQLARAPGSSRYCGLASAIAIAFALMYVLRPAPSHRLQPSQPASSTESAAGGYADASSCATCHAAIARDVQPHRHGARIFGSQA